MGGGNVVRNLGKGEERGSHIEEKEEPGGDSLLLS